MSAQLATIEPRATEAATLLDVIGRASTDPNTDIDKVERLMALYERRMAADAEQEFNAAMVKAQAQMGRVSADAHNSQTRSRYATYGQLDRALRPIYTAHGFALSFSSKPTEREGWLQVVCYVTHSAGHSRTYEIPMPADGKGAKGNDVMTKTHATGSAMSYGMRYLLKSIFNVAIGEDDDDGNGGEPGWLVDWSEKIAQAETVDALKDVGAEIHEKANAKQKNRIRPVYDARMKALKPKTEGAA